MRRKRKIRTQSRYRDCVLLLLSEKMVSFSTFGLPLVALTLMFLQNTHAQEKKNKNTIPTLKSKPPTIIGRTNRSSRNNTENGALSSATSEPRLQGRSEKGQETKNNKNKEQKKEKRKKRRVKKT